MIRELKEEIFRLRDLLKQEGIEVQEGKLHYCIIKSFLVTKNLEVGESSRVQVPMIQYIRVLGCYRICICSYCIRLYNIMLNIDYFEY